MIVGLVLAAGEGRRMGEIKQLLDWQGEPLLRKVVRQVCTGGFDHVRVILGAYATQIRPVLADLAVEIVYNSEYYLGQSVSVKQAVQNLPAGVRGVAFILGDQPLIRPETYRYLQEVFRQQEPGILLPVYQGQRGNPIFFHARFIPALLAVQGDRGGRDIIRANPAEVHLLEVDDPGVVIDLDVKEDYLQALQQAKKDQATTAD